MDMKPKDLFKRVLRFARKELERRARPHDDATVPEREREQVVPEVAPASLPVAAKFEVLRPHEGGLLTLRWSVDERDVARASALLEGPSVLCVRLVSFSKARADVLREVQDRPGVERTGQCEIGEPAQRAVVALGVRTGDRFVSIAHHVL